MAAAAVRDCAVIFDMDGVLVDSYRPHFCSWQRLAGETGVEFGEQDFARTFGMTSREILSHHWPAELSDEQVRQYDHRKEELYRQIIREDFPEMPGAGALVEQLHAAGLRLAIASSGPPENIATVLEVFGHRDCFGALVSGRDVKRGKPDPGVFLLAGERLGVPPERCAVVEDAPAGVEAAVRAGMTPIAITGTADRQKLAKAARIVDSLEELSPDAVLALISR